MTDETRQESAEEAGTATATEPEASAGGAEPAEAEGEKKPERLPQTVEMRDIGPCRKHIKVSVERGAIDRLLNKKFSELRTDASVPGFRPGKTPRKVIERRFHKEVSEQVKG